MNLKATAQLKEKNIPGGLKPRMRNILGMAIDIGFMAGRMYERKRWIKRMKEDFNAGSKERFGL
jgi:hypothetical protein